MGFSNLVALAILITAAATLHQSRCHAGQTARRRRRKRCGRWPAHSRSPCSRWASSAPDCCRFRCWPDRQPTRWERRAAWPVGLSRKPPQAKAFYRRDRGRDACSARSAIFGRSIPIRALVWAAVINGIVAVPVMALLMVMSRERRIMGKFRISAGRSILGWVATALMACAAAGLVVATLAGDG